MMFKYFASQESSQTITGHLGQMSGERFDPHKRTITLPLDAHISSDAIVCSSQETAVSSVSDSRDEEVTMSVQASSPVTAHSGQSQIRKLGQSSTAIVVERHERNPLMQVREDTQNM